jgi:hypothetical protein
VLESGVGGEDRVVRLDDRAGELRGRVDTELEFRLFAIVCRQLFHQKGAETRASSSTEGVEDEKSLEAIAVVGQSPQLVHDRVDEFLSDGVVTTGICVDVSDDPQK